MLEPIRYICKIELTEVPIQWILLIRTSHPSVPQHPFIYVHIYNNGDRIFGFPTHFSVDDINTTQKHCKIIFNFICNKNLDDSEPLKNLIKTELENRIGLSLKISLDDLKNCCGSNEEYKGFVQALWNGCMSLAYGKYIPYGRFYDEMYSIVKFLAALAPLSGGKSEEQMVYDFMSHYGEKINIENEWDHFEFFLIPSYDEILQGRDIEDFPKYKSLYNAIKTFGDLYFTESVTAGEITLRIRGGGSIPIASRDFRSKTDELVESNNLTKDEKADIDFLVDAFNRMPMRAVSYMGAVLNIKEDSDYRGWNKEEFSQFYANETTKGFSMKCAACFLQQAFGNRECIPIDTWIKSFFNQALNVWGDEEIINSLTDIGRFERLIWLTSQARKANMKLFYDVLWCIRHGTPAKDSVRGPNPISCFECKLRDNCVGYNLIKDESVFVQEGTITPSGHADCLFTVRTQNNIPKFVFKNKDGSWVLIDEYSGLILHNETTSFVNQVKTTEEFIQDLQQ